MDNKKKREKLNAQYIANKAVANMIEVFTWSQDFRFGFYSNRFASDREKREFTRELGRIAGNLSRRSERLFAELQKLPQEDLYDG